MENADGRRMVIQAYSIGGGRIRVSNLDGIEVDFSGESNTLISATRTDRDVLRRSVRRSVKRRLT